MKKLVTLIALSWTALASAQTADQYIAAGTNDLTLTNWWGADTNFTAALAVSPTNEDANVLKAVTRLLVLPQTPAGSNFLVALGFPKTNRWLPFVPEGGLPTNNYGDPLFPANYNSATAVAFFRTNILAAITNSAANLAVITDPNYTLSLSSNETLIESVTVDYGDIQMLRALLSAAQFFGYTLNENNLSVVVPQVESWMETNGFTYQLALGTYTSILALQNTGDLPASESALTNAIANYFAASAFIRNRPANAINRLFELDASKTDEEATFRTILTNVLASLNGPAELSPNNADAIESTVNLNAWFSGTNSLNKFLPKFKGDVYVNDSLPNYTFGGIVPDWPAYKTENFLRKEFYSYAGIYGGQVSDITFDDPSAGVFGVFVSTNQQVTVVGYDTDSFQNINGDQSGGVSAQFNVDQHGNWQFNSNSVSGVSGYGSFSKDGSFNGELDFTNGDSVQLNGSQQSPLGSFQNAAGNYSGTWSGTDQGHAVSGTLMAILSANGQLAFCVFHNGAQNDGGQAQFGSNNQFITTDTSSGSTIAGTLSSLSMSGTFTNGDKSTTGTWSMSRSANVAFDVPPVITTNLPASKIVALGTNATFFLSVTGSPPLCYQWFFNSNAIPGATASTLVVSNNLWTSTGTYYISASVNNVAGGTNSQQCAVTVTTETTSPTLAITNITSGMLVSNAAFTVMGTAADNVAVSNVFYSLNNAGWSNAVTGNNWANWSAALTLAPGTNIISAYAVNTGGIPSTTNTVKCVYVVSAPLTVQLTGRGTITPNYSNAVLQVGANYTVTAGVVAGSGFAFANWTGGTNLPLTVLTNGPILRFVMASNLVLQANFVDTNRPVLSITNVTAGMQISNANFIVKGWATDNVAVAGVYFQLNTSGWSSATSFNGTNWTAAVTLVPGTNTIAAYAVDTSGNVSVTNTVKCVYVVSAPLTVQLTGRGTITPNYSNAVLQVGVNYTVTAGVVSGSGFAFTNWTGGTNLPLTVLTNGPILQFVMASNLVLQANFVDTNRPVISITNVTAGMQISNANFIVKGTATDNVAVASVYFQLNTSGWSSATSFNGSNWTAAVTLVPGTNTMAAYAVDTSGNVSVTNTVKCDYVVSAPLTVQLTGRGTITPNYSNAVLQVGANYTVTAGVVSGSGFAFTNWTGGTNLPLTVLTNGPILQFVMASNLVLQANFVDTNRPVISITNVTAGMQISNANFIVKGTATDNVAVASVYFQLNTSGWSSATSFNGSNWTAAVTLVPGTNTIAAYAVDTSGNVSVTNTVKCVYVVSAPLTVQLTGRGTITPNYSNAVLQVGVNYTVTAGVVSGSGFAFTNWTGGTNLPLTVLTNGPILQFVMASNLVLQANFVETNRPTLTITSPTSGQHMTNALATVVGTASDSWKVIGVWYQLNGGTWNQPATTNGWTNWTTTVELQNATNKINAYALNLGGNFSTTNSVSFVSSNAFKLLLAFTVAQPLATNGLNFALQLSPGLNGHVQVSTDLVDWLTLTNFVGTNATIYFRDVAATNLNQRFYRAVTP